MRSKNGDGKMPNIAIKGVNESSSIMRTDVDVINGISIASVHPCCVVL